MSSGADSDEASPRAVRVGPLDSLPAVREELARLYRAARRKVGPSPNPTEAAKLGYLLQSIGQALLAKEMEQRVHERLDAIEQRLGTGRR